MSTKNDLIKDLLARLYQDEAGTLQIRDNDEARCLFCTKKNKETIMLKLKFNSVEHEFYVNFCKKHLNIFNDDEYHYTLPSN